MHICVFGDGADMIMTACEHSKSISIIFPFINIYLKLVLITNQCEIAWISFPLRKTWNTTPCHRGIGHHCLHGHRFLVISVKSTLTHRRGVSLYGTCAQNCADSQTFLCCINILQRKLWNQYWIRKEHKHDTLQSMWIFWCALCLIIDPFSIDIISLINLNMILGGFYHWRRPQFGQLFPMLTWSTPAGWIRFSLSLFFTFPFS